MLFRISPGTALSSLRRALQVRARTQHCWPGREVAPRQPLPHHIFSSLGATRSQTPVTHAGQVYGEQPPKKLEAASEGKVQGLGRLQVGGRPGQPAWLGRSVARALDRLGPSFCWSVSLFV